MGQHQVRPDDWAKLNAMLSGYMNGMEHEAFLLALDTDRQRRSDPVHDVDACPICTEMLKRHGEDERDAIRRALMGVGA